MKRHIIIGIIVLLALTSFLPVGAQMPAGLHMSGVNIVNVAGDRFIASGINLEMYRDYANGCDWVTNGQYAIRSSMSDRLKALGVNTVRLNYTYRFLTDANLTKYLDMATELVKRGIYIMPADHTYTGGVLTNSSASFPTMLKIVQGMRARGLESYLIMGGWNEPGPDISVAAWERAYQNLLTYLRTTAQFSGIVVVDGTGWSTLLDVEAFKRIQAFDANLNGGAANVIFSHHLYPNITDLPAHIWAASDQVPLMIGELGQENPGASPLRPQYVRDVINGFLNTGLAKGHNGLFAWIWAWCDINGMLDDWTDPSAAYSDKSPLTAHGILWRDEYYAKLPTSNVPPPPPTIIVQLPTATPTRSVVPTNTPRPSATRTNTPRPPTATATVQPTQQAEVWRVTGKVGEWSVDLTFERVR